MRLFTQNRLLCFLIYMSSYQKSSMLQLLFGWSKTVINYDFHHILNIVCEKLGYEICWPKSETREQLAIISD
jgi:hypothetical protein